MSKEYDAVVIGNTVSDFLAAPVPQKFEWGEHIVVSNPISISLGGNGAIFAVVASTLGLKVGLNSIVGNDIFGRILVERLKKSGVDVKSVKVDENMQTSATLGIATKRGERTLFHYIGASENFDKDCLDFNLILKSRVVHLCAYHVMPKIEGKLAIEIFKKCKESGIITSFDVVIDPKNKWEVENILKYVDIFLPNYDEACYITKEKKVEKMAQSLLNMGAETVVITMGSKGCFGADKDFEIRMPAFRVNAVDSTGAGDCFSAGFTYATLQYWNLEEKLRFANAVGAISVTKIGGAISPPTIEDVKKFIGL